MQSDLVHKRHLLNSSREELTFLIEQLGLERYRSDQVFHGIYSQLVPDLTELTTLSKNHRELLNRFAVIRTFNLVDTIESPKDGTTKFLWKLKDHSAIESVIIYEGGRITFCISSQVGCALDCKFCATGKMGFIRNLTAGEIVEQVIQMKEKARGFPTNIVFMGMGEPLLNINQVLKAGHIISDPEGLAFSRKKITISTSGVVPGIRKMADLGTPFSLAVSLNSAFEVKRREIMPVTNQYSLKDLSDVLVYYVKKTGKRISFEYIMIAGKNDSRADAKQIIRFVTSFPCKINLIPSNSIDSEFKPSDPETIKSFAEFLRNKNLTVTVRQRKGWEIQAACGQLYTRHTDNIGIKIPIKN